MENTINGQILIDKVKSDPHSGWNPEWEKKLPDLPRMFPYYSSIYDPTKETYNPQMVEKIKKRCSSEFNRCLYLTTMPGKFETILVKLRNDGYENMTHEDKIWCASYVVNKDGVGKGALHSKKNLDLLFEAGYPSHMLNAKMNSLEKVKWLLKEAKKYPNKIPFDIKKRTRFPDGHGDKGQFLREHICGVGNRPPSKEFKKRLQKISPKWIKELDAWSKNGTADQKKNKARQDGLNLLIEYAQMRPRVGLKGRGFNKIFITHKQSQWFKALWKTNPEGLKRVMKLAPWFFERNRKSQQVVPAVSDYRNNSAKKYDLIDYCKNKKNKIYKIGLMAKTKSHNDLMMKSLFTYCTSSRIKNGYDEKFHRQVCKIRSEIKELYPLPKETQQC